MPRYFYWDKKTTVEEATQLSIFKLKEFGLLRGYVAETLTWTRRLSGHKSSIGICVDIEELYAKVNYTITDRSTGEKTDYDYKISPELQQIISAWPSLPEHIKAAIKAMIETFRANSK